MTRVDKTAALQARWAVAAMFLINGIVFGSWATEIPVVKEQLALSPAPLGIALLFVAFGALTSMPLTGVLVSRFGSRPVLHVTAVAFALLLPLPTVAPNFPLLCAVLFAFGGAGGAMDVAMNAHGVAVERRLQAPIMSSLHGMWSLGGLFGAGAGGLLLAFLPVAPQRWLVVVIVLVLAGWALPRLLPPGADVGEQRARFVLPSRDTLLLGSLTLGAYMCEGAILDWSAVFLRDELRSPAALVGAGFAVFSGAMALGRFVGDRLRRRYGGRAVVRGGAILAAASLGFGLMSGSPLAAVLGFAVAGLGLSNIVPVLFSAAGSAPAPGAGAAVAVLATMGYGGTLIGPVLIGFVAEATTITSALALIAVMCVSVAAAPLRSLGAGGRLRIAPRLRGRLDRPFRRIEGTSGSRKSKTLVVKDNRNLFDRIPF